MAETDETKMALSEAVNIAKKLEHEYRAFERAHEAAKVVLTAYNEVESFRRDAEKARGDLEAVRKDIAAATTERDDLKKDNATAANDLKARRSELQKLEQELATFRPHYESEKARLARDLDGLQTSLEADLERQRKEAVEKIEAKVAQLERTREKLSDEIGQLTGRRDALQGQIRNAQAAIGAA